MGRNESWGRGIFGEHPKLAIDLCVGRGGPDAVDHHVPPENTCGLNALAVVRRARSRRGGKHVVATVGWPFLGAVARALCAQLEAGARVRKLDELRS